MDRIARPAVTREDVLAGLSVRHEAYRRKVPLPLSQAMRLASRREHRAVPWVLDRGDGTIVATLLCHPIELALDGRRHPAFGIGSLGTRDAERRRGHAAALCDAVAAASEREGRRVGLLFSAIPPAYYERLGYATAPAWGGCCERLDALVASGPFPDLRPIDPRREVERLAAQWTRAHAGVLHPHRDETGYLRSVEDSGGDDWFFSLHDPDRGHVRLCAEDDATLVVVETVLADPRDEPAVLRGAARLALDSGRRALAGWLEPTAFVLEWFAPTPRDRNLPMLRGAPTHRASRFSVADHF
jgi:predicted N-acetyltransferase YhbS